ncbi:unnamed protein product, partial [Allacma fusca]
SYVTIGEKNPVEKSLLQGSPAPKPQETVHAQRHYCTIENAQLCIRVGNQARWNIQGTFSD